VGQKRFSSAAGAHRHKLPSLQQAKIAQQAQHDRPGGVIGARSGQTAVISVVHSSLFW
jgi:hypothetical protein